jgi:hypothetical protein
MRPLLVLVLPVLGCAHTVSTTLRHDQIGTKYARISGYLATRSAAPGGTHTEGTPGAIRHDVLLDEATLAKIDGQETCVDLVLRTDSAHDEPVDQYRPSFEIDGTAQRGVIERELVSVYDYSFTGVREVASVEGVAANQYLGMSITQPAEQVFRVIERELVSVYDYSFTGVREVASVEGVAANQYLGMSITQPAERVFRVIERRAMVCGGRGGNVKTVRLDVTHPSWDVASYHYHVDFEWKLD